MLPSRQVPRRTWREQLDEHRTDTQAPWAAHTPLASSSAPPQAAEQHQQLSFSTSDDDSQPQQCWICYDADTPQPLVHVCNCTLVAHQDCLLTWLEQQATTQAAAPKCPVCAAPILIREDRSQLLALYKRFRRKIDHFALVAAVGGLAGSGLFVAAAYGAWCVKVFMGDEVAQALLLRPNGGIPWRYWLNLPLIPFSLILSRTPLVDSLLPFLPLTLVLSTHSPYTHFPSFDPLGLDDLTLRYPPSPTLTLCLLPWLRLLYLRLRLRVFRAVLGRKKKYRGLAGVFEEAAEDELTTSEAGQEHDNTVGLVATVEVEVDPSVAGAGGGAPPEQQPEGAQQQQQPADLVEDATGAATGLPLTARLRIGLGRLTSLVLGALLFPALSAGAGSALFWLAARNSDARPLRLLRKVLGVSAVVAASRRGFASGGGSGGGWVKQLVLAPSRALGGGPIDPVWLRNTLGAGLVLLLRDAVELTAGMLENKRKSSRKVVERPFAPSQVGSRERSREATRVGTPQREEEGLSAVQEGEIEWMRRRMSGGRDENGREAVVNVVL
ncbi:hypothetical protein JCM8097_006835 [Rhodosporidiobolus ruineniae]